MVPALIERARREIALARLVGKFTVDFGLETLRKRVVDRVDPITSSAGGGTIEVLADAVDDDLLVVPPSEGRTDTVDVDDLVLPDYDHLPAAHVVAKLASLTAAERDAVEAYELANRHRRTILGKIDQLRDDMIDPTVRRCTGDDSDVAQLRDLELEAREALVDQRGGARWLVEHPMVGDVWRARCTESDVWLAHIDEVVVGYMVADLGLDAIVRIDQVWVTPQARELGFGDGLLEAAIASARQRGARAVEGQALPGDRQTKNLYERAGIVARLITTYREL